MLIRALAFFLFLTPVLLAPVPSAAQSALRIAAVVNTDIISVYDLSARIALIASTSGMPNTPETAQRLAPQVLQALINDRLKHQEAERLGLTVEQAEINGGLARIEKRNNLPPGGITEFLKQKGLKRETLVDQIQSEIIWIKVVNASIRPFVKISDDEIEEVIDAIRRNAGKPEYRPFEILLPVESPDKDGEVRNFANRLIEQIRNGVPFRGLARTFSSASSAENAGDMGWLGLEQIDNDLRATITALKPGEVSQPFRTLGGYHILKLDAVRTAKGLVADDGAVTLQQVFLPLSQNADETELSRQTAAAQSLTDGISTCEGMEAAGQKTGSPLSGSLGKIRVKNLPAAIAGVVTGLETFTPSTPIRVEGGVAVLMVCERDEGNSGLAATKRTVRRQLMNQRLTVAAEKRLRDLRRAAFLDIRL